MNTNDVGTVKYINPSFRAGQVKTEMISPQTKIVYDTKPDEFVKEIKPQQETEGMSTGAKVALWGIGIAVAGLGIWKGKGIIAARKAAKKAAELARLKTLSNLSMGDFKKVGVLEKGKALIDGKGFTGILSTVNGKGQKIELAFGDGNIVCSTINGKQFKNYYYNNKNQLNRIIKTLENGETKLTEFSYHNNGKMKMVRRAIKNNADTEFADFVGFSESGKKVFSGRYNPNNKEMWTNYFNEDGTLAKKIYADNFRVTNVGKKENIADYIEETYKDGKIEKQLKSIGRSIDEYKNNKTLDRIILPDVVKYGETEYRTFGGNWGIGIKNKEGFLTISPTLKGNDTIYRISLSGGKYYGWYEIDPKNIGNIERVGGAPELSVLKDWVSKLCNANEILKRNNIEVKVAFDKKYNINTNTPKVLSDLKAFFEKSK